jgi:hypothetical protein
VSDRRRCFQLIFTPPEKALAETSFEESSLNQPTWLDSRGMKRRVKPTMATNAPKMGSASVMGSGTTVMSNVKLLL